MRPIIAPALALLILCGSAADAAPPAPLSVRASLTNGGLLVTWAAPRGQARACIVRRNPDQLLRCPAGTAGVWRMGGAGVDAELRVRAGDVVRVQAWGGDGALLGEGIATARWRAWLPIATAP